MKRHLLCQLLLAAAIIKPAAADLNVTGTYSGDYSSSAPGDSVTVSGDGIITGGFQELSGANSLFSLTKGYSVVSGTQRIAGAGSVMETGDLYAIAGGTQIIENGGVLNANQVLAVSNSTLNIGDMGTVRVNAQAAVEQANIVFSSTSATLQFTGSHSVSLASMSSAVPGGGNIIGSVGAQLSTGFGTGTTTFSGLISGPLNLSVGGQGTFILSNTNNSYVGSTAVGYGTLEFSDSKVFGNAANTLIVDSGTLRWGAGNTEDLSGRLQIGQFGFGTATIDTNGNNLTFANTISGTGSLIKMGSGTLRLTAETSHVGSTHLKGGELVIAGPSSEHGQLGADPYAFILAESTTIRIESDNALVGTSPYADQFIGLDSGRITTVNNTTVMAATNMYDSTIETTGTGNFTVGNYIFSSWVEAGGESLIAGGAVQFKGDVEVRNGSTLRVQSRVIGNNNLVKEGNGLLVLNDGNTFTGTTIIRDGHIEFSSASAFGDAANEIAIEGYGGLRWAAGNTADISSRLRIKEGTASFDTNGNNITFATSFSGSGGIEKRGAGTLTLSAANDIYGEAVIYDGTLVMAHNDAFGTAEVYAYAGGGTFKVESNVTRQIEVTLNGGAYERTVNGALAGTVQVSSYQGGINEYVRAEILAGSVSTTSTLVISASGTSSATNDGMRTSDVIHFAGTGTDTFVLSMTGYYTGEEKEIGWLDGDSWVNAIEGNIGNTATLGMMGYMGSYEQFLLDYSGYSLAQTIGAYGFDASTQSAWAVLNHNSDFALIPEPNTAALLVLGGVALLARRRGRK